MDECIFCIFQGERKFSENVVDFGVLGVKLEGVFGDFESGLELAEENAE